MKSIASWAALTIVLIVSGAAFRQAAAFERRVTAAEKQLLLLDYSAVDDVSTLAQADSLTARLPWISLLAHQATQTRAALNFWAGDYAPLARYGARSEAADAPDPGLLLWSANAAFRIEPAVRGNAASIQRLERVLDAYAEVLKQAPNDLVAAYNYEYVARVRDELIRPRAAKSGAPAAMPETVHGTEGGAPTDTSMTPFETLKPLEGDERRETEEAGKRPPRLRRG